MRLIFGAPGMDDRFSPVLTDARDIYQNKLIRIMTPHMLSLFEGMWQAAGRKRRVFQARLREVPGWNKDRIEAFTNQILLKTPYLDGAISAVFLAVVKVLSYIRLPNSRTDIRVPVPGKTVFVHTATRIAAKEFYELVAAGQPVFSNIRYTAEKEVVASAVGKAVEELLPFKLLLDAYIAGEIDDQGTMSPEPNPGALTAPPPESLVPRFAAPSEPGEPEPEPEPQPEPEPEPERHAPFPEAEKESRNWMDDGASVPEDDAEERRERRVELSPGRRPWVSPERRPEHSPQEHGPSPRAERPVMSGDAGDGNELDD